jgi:hypothetical protein
MVLNRPKQRNSVFRIILGWVLWQTGTIAKGRRQKAEGRGQKAEGRRQRAEGRPEMRVRTEGRPEMRVRTEDRREKI